MQTPKQIMQALDQYIIGQDKAKRAVAERLINEQRVNFACPANYSTDKSLFKIVRRILDKIKADDDFNRLVKVNQKRIGRC